MALLDSLKPQVLPFYNLKVLRTLDMLDLLYYFVKPQKYTSHKS